MERNTRNLQEFTPEQRRVAAKLLLTVGTDRDHTEVLGSIIAVELNRVSHFVFLVDEHFKTALFKPGTEILEDYHACPRCGEEGFVDELKSSKKLCCRRYGEETVRRLDVA